MRDIFKKTKSLIKRQIDRKRHGNTKIDKLTNKEIDG